MEAKITMIQRIQGGPRKKTGVLLGAFLLIGGCQSSETERLVPERYLQRSALVKFEEPTASSGAIQESQKNDPRGEVEYISGTGEFVKEVSPIAQVRKSDTGAVSLTFKNTEIRILVRAILADTLNVPYVIDPRVDGKATLETSGPISKDALKVTLEALLRTKGFALVPTEDGYYILPAAEAPRNVSSLSQPTPASATLPGFAVQVVPLKYTHPSDMRKILEPFAPAGGILRADDARNLLVLAGTSRELSMMLQTIETFDVSRMAGLSFAIYPLSYVEADKIVTELEEIFEGGEKNAEKIVNFIPIPRLNRLVAVAPNKETLKLVEQWISKLDLGGSAPGRRIYVYQVKNGRAQDISATLNTILGTYGYSGRGTMRGDVGQWNSGRQLGQSGLDPQRPLGATGEMGGRDTMRIVPSEENNSLLILASPSEFGIIETALNQIDVPPRQVLVEVTLAEITLTDELRHGLQWHFETGDHSVTFGSSTTPSPTLPGFSWGYTSSSNVGAVLNALESMTDVKVISSPKILVLNNQSASLQVGDEVPVPTASAVSTSDSNAPIVNTIQYRNTGIILTVTPRINEGGLVMLDVEQEVSNVVETASSGIDAPTVQQRKMSSSIAVQDGATIALGGLIRNTVSRNNSGIPLLKDIPLLGNAFKTSNYVERRSELIVLLTPRVLRDTEETRNAMEALERDFKSLFGGPVEPEDDASAP